MQENDVNPHEGIVILKDFLSKDEIDLFIDSAFTRGVKNKGFYKTDSKEFNSTASRGRMYDAIDTYPHYKTMLEVLEKIGKASCEIDNSIPKVLPSTHLLCLCYSDNRGMGYHRDDGVNDGDENQPIISLSLGRSCLFSFRRGKKKRDRLEIELDHGDVLVFGGPSRMLYHSVRKVLESKDDTVRNKLGMDVRLNFTFRYAPTIIGKEKDFATYTYEHFGKGKDAAQKKYENFEKKYGKSNDQNK